MPQPIDTATGHLCREGKVLSFTGGGIVYWDGCNRATFHAELLPTSTTKPARATSLPIAAVTMADKGFLAELVPDLQQYYVGAKVTLALQLWVRMKNSPP